MQPGANSERGRYEFRDHTGEVEVYLEAADFSRICGEAGRALAELMLGEPCSGTTDCRTVSVEGADRSVLLYNWINELIYRSEVDKVVYTEFDVHQPSEGEVVARICGVEPRTICTAVKAATFHRLQVDEGRGGLAATVVLDV